MLPAFELAASPYFEQDGTPRLHDTFVLFMDLLGTRGVRAGAASAQHLKAVRAAVMRARDACFCEADETTWDTVRWFSDNLAIGYPVNGSRATCRLAELVVEAGYLQTAFIEAGLVGRGALCRGGYFADDTFIYGPALERAVMLEHDRAVHPRCVLDESSIAVATHGLIVEDANGIGSPWRDHLALDPHGVVFVNYLAIAQDDPAGYSIDMDALLLAHRDLIVKSLHCYDGYGAIEEKYRWLAGYHDFVVEWIGGDQAVQRVRRVGVSQRVRGFKRFAAPD